MKTISALILLVAFTINSYGVCSSYVNVWANSCDTYCNGDVVIGVQGGLPPYTLKFDGSVVATLQADGEWRNMQASSGSHSYQFIDAAACTTSGVFQIYYRFPIFNSTITASGATSFCAPGSVTLTAAPGYFYKWFKNNSEIYGANSNTYVATETGDYYCYLMDYILCNVNSNTITVNVSASPPSTITSSGSTTICNGGSVSLNSTAVAGTTYQWSLDNVVIPGATQSSYSASAAGNYTCQTTNICGTAASNTLTVTVVTGFPPVPVITAGGPIAFCSGGSVTLSVSTNPNQTYAWLKNGSSINGATNTTYAATTAGNYSCAVINACGSNFSNVITVSINPGPSASITAGGPTTFCAPGSVTLTATSVNGLTFQWRLNNGPISGATTNTFVATAGGSYTCLVTNACSAISSNAIVVTVNAPPFASISAGGPTTFCSPGSVTMNANTGTGITYQWSLNNSPISGATLSSYTASVEGSYTCQLSNNCGSTVSNALTVIIPTGLPGAAISAGGPTNLCNGTVTLSAGLVAGQTYQWYKNFGGVGGATSSSYVASSSGTYNCVVTNACGSNTSNNIVVSISTSSPSAVITAGGPTTFCTPSSVGLSAGNTVIDVTYQWRKDGVNISGKTTSFYVANSGGSYDCVLTNNCASATSNTIVVTVNVTPSGVITAGGPTSICSGDAVTLNANTGTGLTYQWKKNNINISGETTSSYVATTAGSYNCALTNSCGTGLSNPITVTVNTSPTAAITAGGATTFCSPASVTLNANTGTGLSYQWRSNGVNISGATSDSFVANAAGNYDCVVTNTCGSVTSNAIAVTVNFAPTASITAGGPTTFCAPGSVSLNANTGTGLSYQWRLNGVDISGATSNSFVANTAGNYNCAVSNLCGSLFSNVITVSVSTSPTATIAANGPTTFCTGGSVLLSANTGTGLNYTWKKNGTTISGATTSSYTATTAGSYTVTVANICGSATSSPITVTIGGSAPAQPGTISGPGNFCSGQAGVIYSIAPVAGATSYSWLVPTGAIITAGQGTVSITVTFGNKNGKIKVAAANGCGISSYVSKNVNKNCREGLEATMDLIPELTVFPNPTSSSFTLRISDTELRLVLILRDMTGRELLKKDLPQGADHIEFGSDLPSGIYLAEIIYGEDKKVMRVVKE